MSDLKRIADALERIAQALLDQKELQKQMMAKAEQDAEKQKRDVINQLTKMMSAGMGGMKHGD